MELNRVSGFPKLGVPFLRVPRIRSTALWGLYAGTPTSGNLLYPYT